MILINLPMLEKWWHSLDSRQRKRSRDHLYKGKLRLYKIGNARLRKALYMPALVSIQCNPVMIAFYNRLKEKGKNGKVIVCAIMRKLVHVIFGVLKSGKKYDPNYKPASA